MVEERTLDVKGLTHESDGFKARAKAIFGQAGNPLVVRTL